MIVSSEFDTYQPPACGTVVSIGNFDGVHRGHQAMIGSARDAAHRHGVPLVVMTFDPHPAAILHPERVPPRLTTQAEKLALLETLAVDAVLVVHGGAGFFALAPEAFVALLQERVRPRRDRRGGRPSASVATAPATSTR